MKKYELYAKYPEMFAEEVIDTLNECKKLETEIPRLSADDLFKTLMQSLAKDLDVDSDDQNVEYSDEPETLTKKENPDRTLILNVGFVYHIPDNICCVDDIYKPMVETRLSTALHESLIPYLDAHKDEILTPDDVTFSAVQYFEI